MRHILQNNAKSFYRSALKKYCLAGEKINISVIFHLFLFPSMPALQLNYT